MTPLYAFDGGENVTINVNSAEAKEVMAYWQDMIQSDLVTTDPDFTDEWYQGLANGKYASWQAAAWGPVFLQGTAGNTSGLWRASPLPQWEAGAEPQSGNWGGSTDAVLNTSENPIAASQLALDGLARVEQLLRPEVLREHVDDLRDVRALRQLGLDRRDDLRRRRLADQQALHLDGQDGGDGLVQQGIPARGRDLAGIDAPVTSDHHAKPGDALGAFARGLGFAFDPLLFAGIGFGDPFLRLRLRLRLLR